MDRFKHVEYQETSEVVALAEQYVRNGVLTPRRFNDCLHIAYSVVNKCDFLLTWNMDDLAKDSRREKINDVNSRNRYDTIKIVSPDAFLRGDY